MFSAGKPSRRLVLLLLSGILFSFHLSGTFSLPTTAPFFSVAPKVQSKAIDQSSRPFTFSSPVISGAIVKDSSNGPPPQPPTSNTQQTSAYAAPVPPTDESSKSTLHLVAIIVTPIFAVLLLIAIIWGWTSKKRANPSGNTTFFDPNRISIRKRKNSDKFSAAENGPNSTITSKEGGDIDEWDDVDIDELVEESPHQRAPRPNFSSWLQRVRRSQLVKTPTSTSLFIHGQVDDRTRSITEPTEGAITIVVEDGLRLQPTSDKSQPVPEYSEWLESVHNSQPTAFQKVTFPERPPAAMNPSYASPDSGTGSSNGICYENSQSLSPSKFKKLVGTHLSKSVEGGKERLGKVKYDFELENDERKKRIKRRQMEELVKRRKISKLMNKRNKHTPSDVFSKPWMMGWLGVNQPPPTITISSSPNRVASQHHQTRRSTGKKHKSVSIHSLRSLAGGSSSSNGPTASSYRISTQFLDESTLDSALEDFPENFQVW